MKQPLDTRKNEASTNQEVNLSIFLNSDYLEGIEEPLTKAEIKVAEVFIRGYTYAEIAECRNVSLETVKTQVRSVLSKTGKRDRVDLILHTLSANLKNSLISRKHFY